MILFCFAVHLTELAKIKYFLCMSFVAHSLQLALPDAKKKKKIKRVLNYKPKTLALLPDCSASTCFITVTLIVS